MVSIKDRLNAATYIGVVTDQETKFMTTVPPSSGGLFLTEHRTVTKMKDKGRVASTVIESHSSTAPLGCGAKEKK